MFLSLYLFVWLFSSFYMLDKASELNKMEKFTNDIYGVYELINEEKMVVNIYSRWKLDNLFHKSCYYQVNLSFTY